MKEKQRVGQKNVDQYRTVPSPKARESGFEASYEYTTGNEVSKPNQKTD
ncbi:hypothetical protein [Bacillus sp. Marseille-P3661]|nr:hypothetical protein [Bacillus sp. Marseille-P3661]